ncbi:MAG: hypothetical protein IPG58_20870 [Acidobacteria bacterium]|nr:hypothetical protein [Acidobacteriota bacterium]
MKVEAAGNIFFDVNNVNFEISGGAPAVAVGNATGGEGPSADNPEGDPLVFTITLSSASAQPVTVRVNTNGITASEVAILSRSIISTLCSQQAHCREPSRFRSSKIRATSLTKPFSLDVASATGASVSDGQGIGTIIDRRRPAAIETVEFTEAAYLDDESQSVSISIERFGDLQNPSSVTFATACRWNCNWFGELWQWRRLRVKRRSDR